MSKDQPSAGLMDGQSAPDPSMRDIIASISRLIAEDSRTSEPARVSWRDKTSILELTDANADDGSVIKLGVGEPLDTPSASIPPARTGDADGAAAAVIRANTRESDDALVSAASAETAVAAFGRLGTAAREHRVVPGPLLGPNGPTLEDIIRDALRPLMRAWLDEHLPGIVERAGAGGNRALCAGGGAALRMTLLYSCRDFLRATALNGFNG
jgi:uncharacterized protein